MESRLTALGGLGVVVGGLSKKEEELRDNSVTLAFILFHYPHHLVEQFKSDYVTSWFKTLCYHISL